MWCTEIHLQHSYTRVEMCMLLIKASIGSRNIQLSFMTASISMSMMNHYPSHSGIYSDVYVPGSGKFVLLWVLWSKNEFYFNALSTDADQRLTNGIQLAVGVVLNLR